MVARCRTAVIVGVAARIVDVEAFALENACRLLTHQMPDGGMERNIAVIDFGSQYTQLIVRRVRELGYFAKLYALEDFPNIGKPGAIILSGGVNFHRLGLAGCVGHGVCVGTRGEEEEGQASRLFEGSATGR